jgi:hypothetical protein
LQLPPEILKAMTRGCEVGRILPGVLLGLLVAVAGCRSRSLCPRGQQETRVSSDAIWCRDAKGKGTATYTLFHPGTRQFRQRCTFVGGQLDGPFEGAHPRGQRWIEGNYVNGRLSGRWVQWDSSGRKVAEGEYREGRLVSGAPVAVASICEAVPRVE